MRNAFQAAKCSGVPGSSVCPQILLREPQKRMEKKERFNQYIHSMVLKVAARIFKSVLGKQQLKAIN